MWRVPVIITQSDVVTSAFFPDLGEKQRKWRERAYKKKDSLKVNICRKEGKIKE